MGTKTPPPEIRIEELRLEVERILHHMTRQKASKWVLNRGGFVLRALADWKSALTISDEKGA